MKSIVDMIRSHIEWYRSFLHVTHGALFRKAMLLDRDFLNSAMGLFMKTPSSACNNKSHY